jgi:hypothetical protein
MKNKKGVELSLTTVIIAVILLIVLVVVIFIFTKYMGQQGDVVNKTISVVGDCIPGTVDSEGNPCPLTKDLSSIEIVEINSELGIRDKRL